MAYKEVGKIKGISKITDIKMPIVIPSTDLVSGKRIVFTNYNNVQNDQNTKYITDIELGKAVRASATFPGVYSPFEYKEYQLVDGGILDNMPVEEVKKTGVDKVIAVKFSTNLNKKVNTMYNIIMQSVDLMTECNVQKQVSLSDVLIDIDLNGVKIFNMDKIDYCYEKGYKQTMENIDKIRECVNG